MIYEYLEQYTFTYLINKALETVPDTIDKRQGSIIYDALAPACLQLAELYAELREILINTYANTAHGDYLTLRAGEQKIDRYPATYAVRKGTFLDMNGNPVFVPIGSRFATINGENSVNYIVTSVYTVDGVTQEGEYLLTCEESGIVGNEYLGDLLPLDTIKDLVTATLSTIITPAQNEESDEELRTRYFTHLKNKAFGGNIVQYNDIVKGIEGVAECQVYPVWNGGGTVKVSIIDGSFRAVSNEFTEQVQEVLDPSPQGKGLGELPIGHTATVVTPTELNVDISLKVTPASGFTLSQLESDVIEALRAYMLSLRKQWGVEDVLNNYSLTVYLAQIIYAALSVTGVANASDVTINGLEEDLVLTQTGITQQLPILGRVTLHE